MKITQSNKKTPLLFTVTHEYGLFLVNNLEFTIIKVIVTSEGFAGDAPILSKDKVFVNLEPQSIIKIDEYDPVYDSDFMKSTVIEIFEIKNETLESTVYKLPLKKGRFVSNVLIYSK